MNGVNMSDRKNDILNGIARNKNRIRIFFIAAAAAAFLFSMGLFSLRAQADTMDLENMTLVIRKDDETDFASAASRLAGRKRGVTAFGTGEVRPYSSARLIVRVKDGKRVNFSKYKASMVVESGFGVNLVQFDTERQARKAAASLSALSAVSYVEPDDNAVDTGDAVIYGIVSGDGSSAGSGDRSVDTAVDGLAADDGAERTYSSSSAVRKDQPPDLGDDSGTSASKKTTTSERMSWGVSYIQADQYAAYVKSSTKKSITVAVVDSGVSSHPKLDGRLLKGKDFIDNDNDPTDKYGHGTHVAGIIVDCTPGVDVKILPVRALDSAGRGNVSTIGNAIRYAVQKGAKVINLSLGSYSHYKYLEECIAYANNKGVTVVAAAGNESGNVRYVCPAHLSSPIVVGAINSKGSRAYFSNYGSSLDVVAPGVGIRSCWLRGGYAMADGTSMSTPFISAAAAMYRLKYPSYKPSNIEKLIKKYSKDLGAKGRDNYYGYGVPRMKAAISSKKASLNSEKTMIAANIPAAGRVTVNAGPDAAASLMSVPAGQEQAEVSEKAAASQKKELSGNSAKALSAQEEADGGLKAHIFPSSRKGNAQVHEGCLYRGERLELDVEIVPAQEVMPALKWRSSDEDVAEVDENGVVTALAKGTARIEAALRVDSGGSEEGWTAIGTYFIKVEEPSILTRHASYSANQTDREVRIQAVVKAPGLQDREAVLSEKAEKNNETRPLVLGLLQEMGDGDCLLLGAVDLNGKDAGNVHIHKGEKGRRLKGKAGYTSEDLSDAPWSMISSEEGKRPQDTGMLRLEKMKIGSGKADLVVYAALIPAGTGTTAEEGRTYSEEKGEEISVSSCRLAVYTAGEFEAREAAALDKDKKLVRQIDSNAFCRCSFDIRQKETFSNKAGRGDTDQAQNKGAEEDQAGTDEEEIDRVESDEGQTDQENSDEVVMDQVKTDETCVFQDSIAE